MASNDSFQETCERKSKDGRQIELRRKLSTICEGGEVRGGFDETIKEFSLPKNIRRLPFFHYTIITEMAMKPDIINQRVTRAVKEHMGDIEHTVCPDKLKGKNTVTHSFFIVSPMGLYNLLLDLMKCTGETKDALSILYNASKEKSAFWKKLTPKARVYIRFQVGAYILCSASDLDLAENTNWKQLEKSLTRSLSESVKSDTGVHRALEILMDAARKISSSNSPLEKRTNPPQDSSRLRGSTKRQRPSDLEEDVQREAARLVRPRSGGDGSGDTSEQNAFDGGAFDGSPDSVLTQPTCQGFPATEFHPRFNGILPRRPDNGVQHDALHLVQPEGKGSGTEMSSGQGYNNAIFDGFPASVLTQPTCQGIPAAEFLPGFNGILPRCSDNGVQHDALRLVQPEGKGAGTEMSSGQGYNNAIFDGFPDSILPQPTCRGIPATEFLPGFDGLLDDGTLQNSTPGTPLLVNNNQDGFFMESYDPFAEANPFRFDNDENRSL